MPTKSATEITVSRFHENPQSRGLGFILRVHEPDPKVIFLKVELDAGLTFAWIAINSHNVGWKDKAKRNRVAARRSYDHLLRFRHCASLTFSQTADFDYGVAFLRKRLLALGEVM